MTIQNLYPKQRPEIIYNVINGRNELPVNSTFARASQGTYIDSDGQVKTADVNEPRFQYSASTGEFEGLLLEEATTQLVQRNDKGTEMWSFADASDSGTIMGLPATEHSNIENAGDAAYCGMGAFERGRMVCSFYIDLLQPNGAPVVPNGFITKVGLFTRSTGFCDFAYRFDENLHPECYSIRNPYPNNWLGISGEAIDVGNGIYQFVMKAECPGETEDNNEARIYMPAGYAPQTIRVAGVSCYNDEENSSFITSTQKTREKDQFSLTSARNFDLGFSLLLDSKTTTQDFIYKIKADGTEIASLSNDNGTLNWDINGKSAATNGDYPQVGFLPGRVRTISSFGPAGQGDVENYLYTTGLSFPTIAEPAAGADEIEFGVPQTLKALYGWQGQLNETNAVSLIKGKYNVVPNKPITADAYSFVYNTDPQDEGNLTITLPYIVPAVSMTVDWGDGNSNAYEKGVIPEHTYPYPGQYRIQIEADDGFDEVRIGDVDSTITRVDQWAPQGQIDASGSGFTDRQLADLLKNQRVCVTIPPFKYSGLTGIDSIFLNCGNIEPNDWDFIPYNLPECTSISSAFYGLSLDVSSSADKSRFPQLKTSDKLTSCSTAFYNTKLTGFVDKDNGDAVTFKPITNTQNVTSFSNCFGISRFDKIELDTSSATNMFQCFSGSYVVEYVGGLNTRNVKNMEGCFSGSRLTSTASNPLTAVLGPDFQFDSCLTLRNTFGNCSRIEYFPSYDFKGITDFYRAWYNCANLEIFAAPAFTTDPTKRVSLEEAWYNCESLTSFPSCDISRVTNLKRAWHGCTSLVGFSSSLDTSNVEKAAYAWYETTNLTDFPALDFSSVDDNFTRTWASSGITSFPAETVFPAGNFQLDGSFYSSKITTMPQLDSAITQRINSIGAAWRGCSSMTSFPEWDLRNCRGWSQAWYGCKIDDAGMPKTLDTSQGTSFAYTWLSNSFTTFPYDGWSSSDGSYGFASATSFQQAWWGCSNLTNFAAGMFDNTGTLVREAFSGAFERHCQLTAQAIENILVSLDTNGQEDIVLGLGDSSNTGKADWTEAANTAYDNLIAKGWTISYNE